MIFLGTKKRCWGFLGKSRLQRGKRCSGTNQRFPLAPQGIKPAPGAANQGVWTLNPNDDHLNYVNCLWSCSFALSSPKLLWQQEIPGSIISPLAYWGEGSTPEGCSTPQNPLFSCRIHPNSSCQTLEKAVGAGSGAADMGLNPLAQLCLWPPRRSKSSNALTRSKKLSLSRCSYRSGGAWGPQPLPAALWAQNLDFYPAALS